MVNQFFLVYFFLNNDQINNLRFHVIMLISRGLLSDFDELGFVKLFLSNCKM